MTGADTFHCIFLLKYYIVTLCNLSTCYHLCVLILIIDISVETCKHAKVGEIRGVGIMSDREEKCSLNISEYVQDIGMGARVILK